MPAAAFASADAFHAFARAEGWEWKPVWNGRCLQDSIRTRLPAAGYTVEHNGVDNTEGFTQRVLDDVEHRLGSNADTDASSIIVNGHRLALRDLLASCAPARWRW